MENKVKIASLVSYKFLPPDMGGQKGIAFFNRYLAKNSNLLCITVKENTQSAGERYPVMNILSNSRLRYINLFYFFTLRRILKTNEITHLIIEHPYYGWLAVWLKWFTGVRLIVHSHNIEALRFKSVNKWWWGILWNYERFTHRHADLNFFIHDDDRNYAIERFKLNPGKCITITYGFEHPAPPTPDEKAASRRIITQAHEINETEKILLFNGTLSYKPNLDALNIILEKINPLLLVAEGFRYKIIICGSKLPAEYNGLSPYQNKNIIYAGFVPDINPYFKGADIFLNPVIDGGGIKTKLVEALGYGLSVVSTQSGATGIPPTVAGDKMKLVNNSDWDSFAASVMAINTASQTPMDFYNHFYWGKIAERAAEAISKT